MPQGDPGGHMADTGGYGGNFGGVGGATNQSSSHGGNPTNMSGGVGNYGAVRSAMSRYNNAMGSRNPAGAVAGWSRAQMQMNQRLGLVPGMGFNNPRSSTGTGGSKGGPGRTPGTIPDTIPDTIPETVSPPVDPEAAKTIAAFLGYTKPVGIGSTSILGPQPADPAFNVLSGISAPKAPTTRSVTAPGGKRIADRIPEEQEPHNPIYGGFDPGLNDWTHTDWMNPGDWGAGPGAGHIGWNMGNVDQSGKPIGDQVPGRQFGGPVEPGGKYTVGENGPETLQMNATGGGQVIPHNPMDRLGSMDPQMMQQMFQLMRQQKKSQPMVPPPPPAPPADPAMAAWLQQRPEWGGDPTQKMAFKDSIHAWKDQRPGFTQPPPITPPVIDGPAPLPTTGGTPQPTHDPRFGGTGFQPPQGGGNGTYGGGYRGNNNWNSANAANGTYGGGGRGFNNWNSANAGGSYGSPPFAPPMTGGFGLSGLGQPGVMGQLRQRFGQG